MTTFQLNGTEVCSSFLTQRSFRAAPCEFLVNVTPQNQSQAARNAVAAQAAAAVAYCEANNGTPPAGFVPVGDGPIVGPKQ